MMAPSKLECTRHAFRNESRTGAAFVQDPGASNATWMAAPFTVSANRNEVHIWRVRASEATAALLASCATEAEHARAKCFRPPASRNESIVARGFIRFVLGHYLGIPPRAVQIREGQYGKPELAARVVGRGRVTFNLSHSHGVILAAITVACEVGIDIEFLDSNVQFSEIGRTVFSPAEETWLSQLPDDERQLNYFRCWTRKEAFVKALGQGLSDSINGVEILPAAGALHVRMAGISVDDYWTAKDVNVGGNFVAAIAVAGRNCCFRLWDWPGEPGQTQAKDFS